MVSVKEGRGDDGGGDDGNTRASFLPSFLPTSTAASKRRNVTCAELGNATFTNAPPFDVLGVPECGDAVQPELVLYLPDNGTSNSSSRCARRPQTESG